MQRNMSALRLARASVVRHASDCGSSEVQGASPGAVLLPARACADALSMRATVSILTKRIAYMTEHLQAHPKDNHSRLGLMSMLANRKKLLRYLRRTDGDRYGFILTKLGLKDQVEK
jgi:small subunit ribosomal protein S15